MFDSARKEHFAKKVFKSSVKEGRRMRDEETRRMEEYRRLCKKEGIVSKRLQEYDDAKTANQIYLDQQLKEVEESGTMTRKQRKQETYKIKRKMASRKSTLLGPGATKQKAGPLAKVEKLKRKQEEVIAKREEEKRTQQEQRDVRHQERKQRNFRYSQRTKSGQPVMRSRVACLLEKIQKSE